MSTHLSIKPAGPAPTTQTSDFEMECPFWTAWFTPLLVPFIGLGDVVAMVDYQHCKVCVSK